MSNAPDVSGLQLEIAERFLSINGEGPHAGELAAFVRFAGCNLSCAYCDTSWANSAGCTTEHLGIGELVAWVEESGARRVTVTGGEPLIHKDAVLLIKSLLAQTEMRVEVETNGSVDLGQVCGLRLQLPDSSRLSFTVDVKTPGSGAKGSFLPGNLALLASWDAVKFVVCDEYDFEFAAKFIADNELASVCPVYISPAYGLIEPAQIVELMKKNALAGVRLQLQLHKYIWSPEARGV